MNSLSLSVPPSPLSFSTSLTLSYSPRLSSSLFLSPSHSLFVSLVYLSISVCLYLFFSYFSLLSLYSTFDNNFLHWQHLRQKASQHCSSWYVQPISYVLMNYILSQLDRSSVINSSLLYNPSHIHSYIFPLSYSFFVN